MLQNICIINFHKEWNDKSRTRDHFSSFIYLSSLSYQSLCWFQVLEIDQTHKLKFTSISEEQTITVIAAHWQIWLVKAIFRHMRSERVKQKGDMQVQKPETIHIQFGERHEYIVKQNTFLGKSCPKQCIFYRKELQILYENAHE